MFADPTDVVYALLSYMDEEDCKDPSRAAKAVVDALTGAGLIASKPLNVTGNILIDQLRHDHNRLKAVVSSLHADVARLQNRAEPERQYGHALKWKHEDPQRGYMTAYTEAGLPFAEVGPGPAGGWIVEFEDEPHVPYFDQKHEAIGDAQRQYGSRFLP